MQLKYKIPLILFAVFLLLVGTFVASVLANSSKVRKEAQLESARAVAQDHSNNVNAFFLERIAELKGLENNISVMSDLSAKNKAENIKILLKDILEHPVVSNVYVNEKNSTGKLSLTMTEPYKLKERNVISLYLGSVGMDLDLNMLQKELFNDMQNKEMDSYVVFVSNGGLRVAHPNPSLLLKPVGSDLPTDQQNNLQAAIRKGEYHLVNQKSSHTGKMSVVSYIPMKPKELEQPWSIAYTVSLAALRGDELKMRYTVMGIFGVAIALWFLFLLWLMSSVFKRLIRTIKLLGKMTEGEGDLTIRLAEDGNDEIGQMSRGLNKLVSRLHSTIERTQSEATVLLDTSSMLCDISDRLSKSSENGLMQSANASSSTSKASENAKAIADDASRTSINANELASTAEQMSMNMNSVAGSVEELSASFMQITRDANDSRDIANEATQKSNNATEVMGELGRAAKEIGQVTEVIKRIAEKTNLLALNATIEAAAAGDAGRGFAVVAGEIKELANQSAKSADDIAIRIEDIQKGTSNAVEVIHNVSTVINKINTSIDTIANNVDEQTKASSEISNNAEQASIGAKRSVSAIGEIAQTASVSAQNANSVARGTKNISDGVEVMHEDAKKSNASSVELRETANNLKSIAEQLDSIVRKFKT
jgi:methyl-accepting chemotaxis protein